MELYKLKRNDLFKLLEDPNVPPDALIGDLNKVYRYTHLDGMYAPCYDTIDNKRYYFAAWTEVEPIE
jgi:hypothetical protein